MYRLLIVDDEEEIRQGLSQLFPWSEIGFEVVGSLENGKQALECVRRGNVDVVFCDIRMPVMSGIDLARAIHEQNLGTAVVFLSAHRDFAYARNAIQYGVRGYVVKPTDYRDIRSVFSALKRELDAGLLPAGREPEGAPRDGQRADAFVGAVRAYVEREYARATLKGAARVAHMNPQYACRLFKERTGEHFHTFLTRTRMERAARLLCDVDYLTYEVSELVGYRNPKNFTRMFKQYFGVSPREYRRGT